MKEPNKENNFINEDNSDILIDGDNNTTNINKTTKIGTGMKIGLSIGGLTLGATSGLIGYGVEHINKVNDTNVIIHIQSIIESHNISIKEKFILIELLVKSKELEKNKAKQAALKISHSIQRQSNIIYAKKVENPKQKLRGEIDALIELNKLLGDDEIKKEIERLENIYNTM